MINISRKDKDKIIQDLQEWFQENLEQEIGSLDAEFLTDFLQKMLGGSIITKLFLMCMLSFMKKLNH